jgi:hypothetical protein
MSDDTAEIVVLGLNRAEALDLKRHQQSSGGARLEEPPIDGSSAGVLDPVTLIVVPLGVLAIQGLIAWLAKDRREEVIEQEIEVRHAGGTVEKKTIRIRRSESTSSQQVAEILASLQIPTPSP